MKTIAVEKKESVLHIELNRPEVRNAFHPDMIAELTKVFAGIGKDKSIRVVQLSGRGKSFCAGADLDWMRSMARFTQAQNLKDAEKLFKMFQTIQDCPAVILTRAHGHVMGGALGLLAVSDFVVAEEKTEFCFSEAKLGLSPAVISAFVKNKMSAVNLSRWFLTADVFSSQEALASGLITSVRSGAGADEQLESWTQSVLACGPQAIFETKKLLRKVCATENSLKLKSMTTKVIAQLRVSQEGQEGLNSFFEKRAPGWRSREGN